MDTYVLAMIMVFLLEGNLEDEGMDDICQDKLLVVGKWGKL